MAGLLDAFKGSMLSCLLSWWPETDPRQPVDTLSWSSAVQQKERHPSCEKESKDGKPAAQRMEKVIPPCPDVTLMSNQCKPLIVLDLDETLVHCSHLFFPWLEVLFAYPGRWVYKRPFVDQFLQFCFSHFEVGVWTAASEQYAQAVVSRLFCRKGWYPLFLWSIERCTAMLSLAPSMPSDQMPRLWENTQEPQDPEERMICLTSSNIDNSQLNGGVGSVTGWHVHYIKDIKKIRRKTWQGKKLFHRHNILIVDDNPITYVRNYGNAIPVAPFWGRHDDDELVYLVQYLIYLLSCVPQEQWRYVDKQSWRNTQLLPALLPPCVSGDLRKQSPL